MTRPFTDTYINNKLDLIYLCPKRTRKKVVYDMTEKYP